MLEVELLWKNHKHNGMAIYGVRSVHLCMIDARAHTQNEWMNTKMEKIQQEFKWRTQQPSMTTHNGTYNAC